MEAILPYVYAKLGENGHKPDLGVESPAKWWAKLDEETGEFLRQKDKFHAAWLRADTPSAKREFEEMMREGADCIICMVDLMTHGKEVFHMQPEAKEESS